jgi:serine/threonine protein kinase
MRYQSGDLIRAPGSLYRVERALGEGGMGEVYKCLDKNLNTLCAIKMLGAKLARQPTVRARFEREARANAQLAHKHVVRVMRLEQTTDDATPFFVMEFLPGTSLRARLKRGTLSPQIALNIAIQILYGLHYAHERGIVHRDVKPENILLTYDDDGGMVAKVIDFGVMRVLTEAAEDSFGGTFAYAAPEQILDQVVGPRADLFSVGVILFEMLAGRRPFDLFGFGEAGARERACLPPPRLSEIDPAFPSALVDVVASSMDPDPTKRQGDAFQFASRLREIHGALGTLALEFVTPMVPDEPSNRGPITMATLEDPTDPDGDPPWLRQLRAEHEARELLDEAAAEDFRETDSNVPTKRLAPVEVSPPMRRRSLPAPSFVAPDEFTSTLATRGPPPGYVPSDEEAAPRGRPSCSPMSVRPSQPLLHFALPAGAAHGDVSEELASSLAGRGPQPVMDTGGLPATLYGVIGALVAILMLLVMMAMRGAP